jgi:tetratricopeptide (TPR) repeat protein
MSEMFFKPPVHPPAGQFGRQDFNAEGEALFARGDFQEAMKCFERAIQHDPFHAKAHNNLSVAHWHLGNREMALNSLTRALEIDPNDQDVILNCSNVFQNLGQHEDARQILEAYLQRKPWDQEAKRELEKLTDSPPASGNLSISQLFTEQGEKQFAQGKLDHAKACFEMAMEHEPENARAHSNLGVLHWRQGDLEKALTCLHQALELDSEDPDILYNSARALSAAGEMDAAADLLKMYLQRNPQDESAWRDYGSLLREMGGTQWQGNGLSSEVAGIYLQMGKKLCQAKDYAGAGEALQRALTLDPGEVEVYCAIGRLHQQLGRGAEALEALYEGLEKQPGHKASILAAGEILFSLDRKGEAESLYRDFLSSHKDKEVHQALKKLSTPLAEGN